MKTLAELKATIADWIEREDLQEEIPSFINLAEKKIYRIPQLRNRHAEFRITKTAADDPFNPIELPDNFSELKLVVYNDLPLIRISDQQWYGMKKAGLGTDFLDTMYYMVTGRQLYILNWPEATKTEDEWGTVNLIIDYYGTESITEMATWNTPTNPNQVPESDGTLPTTSMRGDTATTRLFQIAPDLYLYGALVEAYLYLREPTKAAEYKELFREVVAGLVAESDEAEYAGSTVEVQSVYHD